MVVNVNAMKKGWIGLNVVANLLQLTADNNPAKHNPRIQAHVLSIAERIPTTPNVSNWHEILHPRRLNQLHRVAALKTVVPISQRE